MTGGIMVMGQVRGQANWLACHLARTDTNEAVELIGVTNLISEDIAGAMAEIRVRHGRDRRCCLHAKIAIEPTTSNLVSIADWCRIARLHAKALGLESQSCLMVLHQKCGRAHLHLVYSVRGWRDSHIFKRNVGVQFAIAQDPLLKERYGLEGQLPGHDALGRKLTGQRPKPPAQHQQHDPRPHLAGVFELALAMEQDPSGRAEWIAGRLVGLGWLLVQGTRTIGVVPIASPSEFHPLRRRVSLTAEQFKELGLSKLELLKLADLRKLPADAIRRRTARAVALAKARAGLPQIRSHQDVADWRVQKSAEHGYFLAPEVARLLTTPVWPCRDGTYRAKIGLDLLRFETERLSVQTKPVAPASNLAIFALILEAKARGWASITLTGAAEFRQRAAFVAGRLGLGVADEDLLADWQAGRRAPSVEDCPDDRTSLDLAAI